jgi:hypothetical protein
MCLTCSQHYVEFLQVVSQYSSLLAPMAVDAVLNVIDPGRPNSVDLKDIKVLKKLGGTVCIWSLKVLLIVVCLLSTYLSQST